MEETYRRCDKCNNEINRDSPNMRINCYENKNQKQNVFLIDLCYVCLIEFKRDFLKS